MTENKVTLDELRDIRRDLHRIPEQGLQEYKTAAYLEQKLKDYGITHIKRSLETGVIALIEGDGKWETIAFRADMDALPIIEEGNSPYASCHPGMMHACGHDGHMAILLGFAKYLAQNKKKPKGDVLLIFQPAEEGPGGAELMIKSGILAKYGVKKIVGCHIFPHIPQGKIACRKGAMLARNGEVTIRIAGESAHGAQPHLGKDALLTAGAVVTGLHTIVSRNLSPLDSGVLTFGTIHGGDACNVIAKEVVLEGTMRAFSDTAYEQMEQRIKEGVNGIAMGYGCKGEAEFRHMYRVVENDPTMVDVLQQVCGEKYMETQPYMLAEDFSMFQQAIPGVFFFLGSQNEEKGFTYPLHHPRFGFDETILLDGVEVYAKMLKGLQEG